MIWCSTQGHFDVRASTAKLLAMDLGKLKVIASEIGGGFRWQDNGLPGTRGVDSVAQVWSSGEDDHGP